MRVRKSNTSKGSFPSNDKLDTVNVVENIMPQNGAIELATGEQDGGTSKLWIEHEDDKGQLYYEHTKDMRVTWTAPSLPEGWEEHTDDFGTLYYHDAVTSRTTWTRPLNDEED